jgi:hypothetical protein
MSHSDFFVDRFQMYRKTPSCRCDPFTVNQMTISKCECPYIRKEEENKMNSHHYKGKYLTLAILLVIIASLWFIGFTHWK